MINSIFKWIFRRNRIPKRGKDYIVNNFGEVLNATVLKPKKWKGTVITYGGDIKFNTEDYVLSFEFVSEPKRSEPSFEQYAGSILLSIILDNNNDN